MTKQRFVETLPDLIQVEEYADDPGGRRVRLRIPHGPRGIEVLGDAMRAEELERLLDELGVDIIERMLCG